MGPLSVPLLTPSFYPTATVALDFTAGRYRVGTGSLYTPVFDRLSGLTVTRASVGYAERNDGTLVLFGTNTARITDKGLLVEESRTNKCANTNVNPSATTNITLSGDAAAALSVVDDSAALAAAVGITGNVYKLDNSGGSAAAAIEIVGSTGNTNQHMVSVYARGAGSGKIGLSTDIGGSVTWTATYQRHTSTRTPVSSGTTFRLEADPGSVVYFILNQLEEGSFVTSPIPVTGASATRAADVVSIANAGGTIGTYYANVLGPPGGLSNSPRIIGSGSSAQTPLYIASSYRGGTFNETTTLVTATTGKSSGQRLKTASAGNGSGRTVVLDGAQSATDANAYLSTLSGIYLGSERGSTSFLNSYIESALYYPEIHSVSQMLGRTQ